MLHVSSNIAMSHDIMDVKALQVMLNTWSTYMPEFDHII